MLFYNKLISYEDFSLLAYLYPHLDYDYVIHLLDLYS
jgi:hypothetical protein